MEKTLELIGSLQPGQKFYIRYGQLEIERNPWHISTITRRWYNSVNRTTTIKFIDDFIKTAASQRCDKIEVARQGLENLRKTYQNDPKTVEQINKIIGFIDYTIKSMTLDRYIWQNSSNTSRPISFPPSPSCAITVLTGAKGQILSTSSNATSEQFRVGSLPKNSRTL